MQQLIQIDRWYLRNEGGLLNCKSVITGCPEEAGGVGSPGSVAAYKPGNKMENVRFKWYQSKWLKRIASDYLVSYRE